MDEIDRLLLLERDDVADTDPFDGTAAAAKKQPVTFADDPDLLSVSNMLMRRYGDSHRFKPNDTIRHALDVIYRALVVHHEWEGGLELERLYEETRDPRVLDMVGPSEVSHQIQLRLLEAEKMLDAAAKKEKEAREQKERKETEEAKMKLRLGGWANVKGFSLKGPGL
jgi:hypothetical protein